MEYILIGILFVAVLSCTMKMIKMIKMNGSFIEGFGAATADADVCGTVGTPTVAVCELNNDFVPTEAYNVDGTGGSWYRTLRIALPTMASQNAVKLSAPSASDDQYIIILFNETISTASLTIAQILYSSSDMTGNYRAAPSAGAGGWTLNVKVRKISDQSIDYLEIISKKSTEPTTFSPMTPTTSLDISATISVITLSGSTQSDIRISTESDAVAAGDGLFNATKSTCEEIMFLNGGELPDTTPTETCIGDCYTFTDADTSPCSGPNSLGCQPEAGAATGGGNCLCGDGIGDGGEMKFYEEGSSWPYSYPTDPNSADGTQITGLTLEDTESCLKSAIDQSISATNNADLCHPRWPCISSMNDYLEILNTPLIAPAGNPTADVCNKTVTGDDLDNQNKIPISLCVPYDNADGKDSECYENHTMDTCESVPNDDDDSTTNKCVWNPYCQMPTKGRDKLGNVSSEETRTSKVYTDMLTCIKSENIWDLPMMEELNDKRDTDNNITFPDGIEHYTNTTEFGFDAFKSAMGGNGLGCHVKGNGGDLMCALSSAAYNSADRLYGQCPGELEHSPCIQDEDIPDSGDQGSCTYCRTTNTNSTVVDTTITTIQGVDPTGATTFLTDTFGITPSGDPKNCTEIY